MPRRNTYRALLIDVPRTGNFPEQMARALMSGGSQQAALGTLSRPIPPASIGSLLRLGDNWYMLVQERTVYYCFAPKSGLDRPDFDRINIAARTSTTPVPWADEKEMVAALNGALPEAFRTLLH